MHAADEAIAARDPALPGLPLLLDAPQLLAALQTACPNAGITQVHVDYLRYKPGTSCLAGLRVIDAQGMTVHAFARALPAQSRDWHWQQRRMSKRRTADGRFSAHALEAHRLVVARVEYDRRVTALEALLDKTPTDLRAASPLKTQPDDEHSARPAATAPSPSVIGHARASVLPADQEDRPAPFQRLRLSPALRPLTTHAAADRTHLGCRILRYKPERRLVARVLDDDGLPLGILRACTADDFQATLNGAQLAASWQGTAPLAVDPGHHALVMPWIPGTSLAAIALTGSRLASVDHDGAPVERNQTGASARISRADNDTSSAGSHRTDPGDGIASTGDELAWPHQLGERLAQLHSTRLEYLGALTLPERSRQQDLHALRQATDTICLLQPELAAETRALQRRVHNALTAQAFMPCPVHGDLSLEQIIITPEGELLIIDWDNVALGDPMQDIGTLLARLAMQHLQGADKHTDPRAEQALHGRLREQHKEATTGNEEKTAPERNTDNSQPTTQHDHSPHAAHRPALAGTLSFLMQVQHELLRNYELQGGHAQRISLQWHLVAGLLRLMPEGFRQRHPDWSRHMQQLLTLATMISNLPHDMTLPQPAAPARRTGTVSNPSPDPVADAMSDTRPDTERPAPPKTRPDIAQKPLTETASDAAPDSTSSAENTPDTALSPDAMPSLGTAAAPGTTDPRQADAGTTTPNTSLGECIDPARMRPLILSALGLHDQNWQLRPVQVLRHKPGRRALLQYVLSHPVEQKQVILGKLRFKGLDKRGFRVQKALFEQGFDIPKLFVPEALAMLPEQRLWLQRKVGGVMASKLITPQGTPTLSERIGRAIASLHRTKLDIDRHWTLDDELKMLDERLQQAATARPAWADRIHALMQALRRMADGMSHNPSTGIHRDCYADQILVDEDRLWWLDLDLYCQGDPALDVGNFVAHLMEDALRHHRSETALDAHRQALVDAYQAECPDVKRDSIEGWTTLALARHVQLSTQFSARLHTTLPLIECCEQRLAAWR